MIQIPNLLTRLFKDKTEAAIFFTAFLVEIAFGLYLIQRWGFTFANRDAVTHLYIPRTVVDNSPYSNLANIGTVWLPMFHLLVMPLVLIDPLYTTGFAGTIVNALATSGICVILYRLLGGGKLGISASALYICNAFTLIYGATPMTEQTAIFLMALTTYYFKRYWETDSVTEFMKCSIALIFGTLIRYEVWAVAFLVIFFFVLRELKNGQSYRLAYANLPLWGIFAWFFWNLAIFRDPLMFIHHPLSAQTQAALTSFYYAGSIPLTMRVVFAQSFIFSGALCLLTLLSIPILLIHKKALYASLTVLLISPILLHCYLAYTGLSWAQTRFFYMGFPGLIATAFFNLNGARKWMKSIATFGLIILVSFSYPVQLIVVTTGRTSSLGITSSFDVEFPDFSTQIRELKIVKGKVVGSSILMGGASPPCFSIFTDSSPSLIFDGYDSPFYIEVMDKPWNYTSYVLIEKSTPNDPYLKLKNDYYGGKYFLYHYYNDDAWCSEFLRHYMLVLETEHYLLYQLKV